MYGTARTKETKHRVITSDDMGWFNTSIYNRGVMGYRRPNIVRTVTKGTMFIDWTSAKLHRGPRFFHHCPIRHQIGLLGGRVLRLRTLPSPKFSRQVLWKKHCERSLPASKSI
jgi:hypothetical protein